MLQSTSVHSASSITGSTTSAGTARVVAASSPRHLSSSSSEATVVEVEEKETVELTTGQQASTSSASGVDTGSDSTGKQQLTLDWLKDFDPGLISDYFSSSDEPRLMLSD